MEEERQDKDELVKFRGKLKKRRFGKNVEEKPEFREVKTGGLAAMEKHD